MKVLIVEDEYGAAHNLSDLISIVDSEIEILAILETVSDAVEWIANNEKPDLGFFDIRLADGDSFDIFTKINVSFPVIFTTGYDEYALKAFKVNSIDYILKPVGKKELENALNKYHDIYCDRGNNDVLMMIKQLQEFQMKKHRKSLLVYVKDKIIPISIDDIAYFYLDNELVYCVKFDGREVMIDKSLEKIWTGLDSENFFRVNRQFVVSRKAVVSAIVYYNRKLKLEIKPAFRSDILISKLKVTEFKNWLGGV